MSKKQKITILSHNLSENCLGRAYILAKALESDYVVSIIGPMSGADIWTPVLNDKSITYVKFGKFPNPFSYIKSIDGDIIYAVKPRFGSFGYALLARLFTGKKLVLDIDDWEVGFSKDASILENILNGARFWVIDNTFYTWLMEKCVSLADAVTVSNTFLQKKFGGVLVPHFRDVRTFDPEKFDRNTIRKSLELPDKKVVMFMGTIRAHKGIDTLIEALDALHRKDIVLVLVGVSEEAKKFLPKRHYLRTFGFQPFEMIPEFLAAADVVALMQKGDTASAQGQLPAKIFDAMAMAKPIISTKVSDIPTVLDGCGIVISDNAKELALAISFIFDNPEEARKMGESARKRCVESYSYDAIRPTLGSVFRRIS